MKLVTLKDGSRDGQLAVVSRDLSQAHFAAGIATTLQQVLDDWNFISPQLQDLSTTLNHGKARHAFPFDPQAAMAPLPRGGQCALQALDADAGHVAPVQWPADHFLGPSDALWVPAATGTAGSPPLPDTPDIPDPTALWLAPGVAAITGDIERGTPAAAALDGVRLLLFTTAALLPQPGGAAPWPLALACAPVALTPDELGPAWVAGRVQLDLAVNAAAPQPLPDTPLTHLGTLIAALARLRALRAGAVVGWRLPAAAGAATAWPQPGSALADSTLRVSLREAGHVSASEPFGALTLRLLPSAPQG